MTKNQLINEFNELYINKIDELNIEQYNVQNDALNPEAYIFKIVLHHKWKV